MSNKTLGITIAVIVVVGLGIWGGLRIYHNSEVKSTSDQGSTQPADNATNQPAPPINNSINPTPVTTNDCTRNFDQSKLASSINTKNQFVTLDVKGYGAIKIQLYDKDAPKTVENFLKLTNAGFYDCLTFHRVAHGFVIQGGDPNGDGTGGQSAFGAKFADELNPNTPSYKAGYVKGVVAMANSGPNTNGSQFFIVLADLSASLPKNYTIFGKVVAGQDAVDKIGQVAVTPGQFGAEDGMPKVPVVITKATISSK